MAKTINQKRNTALRTGTAPPYSKKTRLISNKIFIGIIKYKKLRTGFLVNLTSTFNIILIVRQQI